MKKTFYVTFIFFFSIKNLVSQKVATIPQINSTLKFTENKGQWDSKINYRLQLNGGFLFMENDGLTFNFYDTKKYRQFHTGGAKNAGDFKLNAHAYRVEFLECNSEIINEHYEEGSDYENFFIGKDKSKWKGEVRNYHRVLYKNIYNGINYEAITSTKGIKYNFYVSPKSDPKKIQLNYQGVEKIRLINNELQIELSINEIIEKKPYAYQLINGKIINVECSYSLNDWTVGFDFPNGYDKNYELVIDPILVFAASSGSTADNFGMTATYDKMGNLYSGGTAFDIGYPTTFGAYSINFNGPASFGNTDVVITKYNSTGSNLIYSTYMGGNASEIVTSMITDNLNNLYLYGATSSTNFPTSASSYNQNFNGGVSLSFMFNGTSFVNGTDIYLAKLNSSGTTLLGSTYFGGNDNDGVNHNNTIITYTVCGSFSVTEYPHDSLQMNYGDQYRGEIQLDKSGNVYISSSTRSNNIPIVSGFDNTLGGKQDGVVAKFNSSLSNLIWSTYLGGSGNDAGYSIVVDDTNQVYVTGGTYSMDFPTTIGCFNTVYNGGKADGYITKINPLGNSILKSTYIGTTQYDQSFFIQMDKLNNVYIYGQSLGNMPIVGSVYSNPGSHQFISILNSQLTSLIKSTVIGSGNPVLDISPSAFGVDDCGNIYLTGWGGSFMFCTSISTMPILNPIQANPASSVDYYIMGLSQNLSSILFGSYFGGSLSNEHVDGGTSRISKNGILYQSVCSGCSGNDDFPVTPGAWPNTPGNQNHSFNCNNGVFKFDFQPNICNANFISNGSSSCAPVTYSLNNTSSNYLNWHWQFNPGNITSTLLNPTQSYTNAGNYTITLVVTNSLSCNLSDSVSNFLSIPLCTDVNQNNKSLNSFLVYPNPTSGFIYVIPQVYSSGLISIELYNVMGQKILLQNIMVTYDKIDINSFENGIYYLKIMTKEGQEVLKIVKD